jgi:molybdopterin-binding protein
MELSARNRIPGTIKAVRLGEVMAEVTIGVGENEIVAVITRSSAERMKLSVGDNVSAVIKATEVMVSK